MYNSMPQQAMQSMDKTPAADHIATRVRYMHTAHSRLQNDNISVLPFRFLSEVAQAEMAASAAAAPVLHLLLL